MTCASCVGAGGEEAQPARGRHRDRQPGDRLRVGRLRPGDVDGRRPGEHGASAPATPRPSPPTARPTAAADEERVVARSYRRRLLVAAPLTVAGRRADDAPRRARHAAVRRLALALATPVVLWAGWPFHRAAAVNARHGASTMDTLVSLGTLVAYGLVGGARR